MNHTIFRRHRIRQYEILEGLGGREVFGVFDAVSKYTGLYRGNTKTKSRRLRIFLG